MLESTRNSNQSIERLWMNSSNLSFSARENHDSAAVSGQISERIEPRLAGAPDPSCRELGQRRADRALARAKIEFDASIRTRAGAFESLRWI